MRVHSNRWVDWGIKVVGICGAAVATAKAIAWVVHPTLVAAQTAILHPAMIRIEAHEQADKTFQDNNEAAMTAIIEMLATPPNSPQRARIANAYKKRKVDGGTPQAGATDPR